MSVADEKGSSVAPRPARLERLQRTDQDFHKVMSDFDELMALANSGHLSGGPAITLPPEMLQPVRGGSQPRQQPPPQKATPYTTYGKEGSPAAVSTPPSFTGKRGTAVEPLLVSQQQQRLDGMSAIDCKHVPALGVDASQCGTPPISAGGASIPSRASSSDSSIGGSIPRGGRNLPPLPGGGVSSSGSILRPNSVPLHVPESLLVGIEDDERPASMQDFHPRTLRGGDAGSSPPLAKGGLLLFAADDPAMVEALLLPNMSAQRDELQKEMAEIDALRKLREVERVTRQRQRDARRQRLAADAAAATSGVAFQCQDGASRQGGSSSSSCNVGGGDTKLESPDGSPVGAAPAAAVVAAAVDPAVVVAQLRQQQQAAIDAFAEDESTTRNTLVNTYAQFVLSCLSDLEAIKVIEESEHRIRIRRILDQGTVAAQRDEERRKLRILEATRDCVRDQTDDRQALEVLQAVTFAAATQQFLKDMESPATGLIVEERLERTEWLMTAENEMFGFIAALCVTEREGLERQRVERMASRLCQLTIAEPLAALNKGVALLRVEAEHRRLMRSLYDDEHDALWEWHCEEVLPRLERQVWHTIVRETNLRLEADRKSVV